jgi:predicted Rdx family selenoprotein
MPQVPAPLPRVTIQFCTQCKWMLRAAYVSRISVSEQYFLTHLSATNGSNFGTLSHLQNIFCLLGALSISKCLALNKLYGNVTNFIRRQFAQELLSTFGTSLGEVSLQPATGGTFIISIYYVASQPDIQAQDSVQVQHYVLWDRKIDGGFPGKYFGLPKRLF